MGASSVGKVSLLTLQYISEYFRYRYARVRYCDKNKFHYIGLRERQVSFIYVTKELKNPIMSSNCAKRVSAFKLYLDEVLDGHKARAIAEDHSLTGRKLYIVAKKRASAEFKNLPVQEKVQYQKMADEENRVAPALYINEIIAKYKVKAREKDNGLTEGELFMIAIKLASDEMYSRNFQLRRR